MKKNMKIDQKDKTKKTIKNAKKDNEKKQLRG